MATEDYVIQAPSRDMVIYGLATMRIAVDSIALDTRGEWLYYGAVTGSRLYRVRTRDLNDDGALAPPIWPPGSRTSPPRRSATASRWTSTTTST